MLDSITSLSDPQLRHKTIAIGHCILGVNDKRVLVSFYLEMRISQAAETTDTDEPQLQ